MFWLYMVFAGCKFENLRQKHKEANKDAAIERKDPFINYVEIIILKEN